MIEKQVFSFKAPCRHADDTITFRGYMILRDRPGLDLVVNVGFQPRTADDRRSSYESSGRASHNGRDGCTILCGCAPDSHVWGHRGTSEHGSNERLEGTSSIA